jgi:hypothetical protein
VFARQTGMACSACHFNHFPLLNPFGRAFKASGYTLMGGTEQVEGEDLELPNRLNMAMLATAGHQSVSTANGAANIPGANGWYVPGGGGELNLFIGGKVSEMSGFLTEFGLGGTTIGGGSGKLLIMPEVADGIHAGLVIYQIGQDAAGSFELLNTGATSIHRLMGNTGIGDAHIQAYSARQFIAPEGGATGISLVAASDKWFVNASRYANVDGTAGYSQASNLPGQYLRAAMFFDLVGFDSAVGFQNWSGRQDFNFQTTTASGAFAANAVQSGEERATVIDFQMQGELGGQGLGFYASYGKAPKSSAGVNTANIFNASATQDKTSFNVAADYTVMPKVTLQGAYRSASVPNAANTGTEKDNAIMVGIAYELAMNQHLTFNYTSQSGSAYNVGGVRSAATNKTNSTVLLESFF